MDEQEPQRNRAEDSNRQLYTQNSNLEAHIIADMLRIESITAELRELKSYVKERVNKLENWIVAIVGVTVTTLLATLGSIIFKLLS